MVIQTMPVSTATMHIVKKMKKAAKKIAKKAAKSGGNKVDRRDIKPEFDRLPRHDLEPVGVTQLTTEAQLGRRYEEIEISPLRRREPVQYASAMRYFRNTQENSEGRHPTCADRVRLKA